jgi:FkbM family methyltransferase
MRNLLTKIKFRQSQQDKFGDFSKKFGKTSFSQLGEDLIIDHIFNLRGISYPSYIDIGANHPFSLSNTALFYMKGCRGINVEPDPNLIENFYTFRSNDINLNFGLGKSDGIELDFFILNEPTLNTFSKSELDCYIRTGKYHLLETQKLKIYSFEYLIKNYSNNTVPDFISIDVEGFDFEIIKSINFDLYRAKVICIEAYDYSPIGCGRRREQMLDYIKSKDYCQYADTGLNAIFVSNEFWYI